MPEQQFDVIVVGAGNAALSAAVAAVERGAKVLVLEKSPKERRGGNTRFTAIFRFIYNGIEDLSTICPGIREHGARAHIPAYTVDNYVDDMMKASGGHADRGLMQIQAAESLDAMQWLTGHGLKWNVSIEGAKEVDGKLTWQTGGFVVHPDQGGVGILDTLFGVLERKGVDIRYDTPVIELVADEQGTVRGVKVRAGAERDAPVQTITARSIILAAGGFEASAERRAKYLGPGWDLVKVRGSRDNTGEVLDMALALNAGTTGHWSGCHATMVHANGASIEMGDAAFPHAYPYSLVVNLDGERITDEGENLFAYTYAKLGQLVRQQKFGRAFQVFDAKTVKYRSAAFYGDKVYKLPHVSGNDLRAAAVEAGIDPDRFVSTITEFNKAVQPGTFDPSRLDGKRTKGLAIDKTNWALPIDTPPYEIVPVECGITFTFGGLKFNEHGQALDLRGIPIKGLYVIGEMAGTFYLNYPGSSGLTKGVVFGRRAGAHAAARN